MTPSLTHRTPSPVLVWWTVLRIAIEERLAYRGDFMLGTLMRFLPIVTQIFLWIAVFDGSGKKTIVGYTFREMVAYYLLTNVARAFSSMPGLAAGIAKQIRSGEIKKYLVQPVDMIGFLLLGRVAHKLVYYAIATLPYALVFFLCRQYFDGWPDALTMLAFIVSLILGFLLGFLLEALMGMLAFWLLEVNSLLFVFILFTFFFSGHMFPLDMLTGWFGTLIRATPLQYLAYFQATVFLQKVQGPALWTGLLIQLAWVVGLTIALRVAYTMGVKRYAGYGG